MGKYDFAWVKQNVDIAEVVGRFVKLKKDGPHYYGKCPFHGEETSSLCVTPDKKIYKCFGCGRGGDVVDFLMEYGNSRDEAFAYLKGDSTLISHNNVSASKGVSDAPVIIWRQDVPESWPTRFVHPRYGEPIFTWPYADINGVVISYDCRFEGVDDDGKPYKQVLPLTYCRQEETGKKEWRWQAMDKLRSLWNIDRIFKESEKAIWIVEGRKAAEAAQTLSDNVIVVTWQGGGKAVNLTDWTPLTGRKVIIWQDHDYAGYQTTEILISLLGPIVDGKLRFIHNDKDADKGYDAADAVNSGLTKATAKKIIAAKIHYEPQLIEKPAPSNAINGAQIILNDMQVLGPEGGEESQIQAPAPTPLVPDVFINTGGISENIYFRFLGFTSADGKLHHCFYQNVTKTIIKLTVSSMGKGSNLLELAPLMFWEMVFTGKTPFEVPAAVNWLVTQSQRVGIFNPENIRGRGAWLDNGRVVVHVGSHVIVDGEAKALPDFNTAYIYEQGAALKLSSDNPLSTKDASKFLELTKRFNWERSISAHLLAGWCVIAPYCGAMSWRPHIWITGPAGSGKTWILRNVAKAAIGNAGLFVQGATSEAGLRQALRRDALPVGFDEAEGESSNDQDRMDSILRLMRAASAEDGGEIMKGSSGGSADGYRIRSCFAFASIGVQLNQQSDRTRVTVLSLNHSEDENQKDKFTKLLKYYVETITPEFIASLQARSIRMLPIILQNARTFSLAGAALLGVQRTGDQLGALLAGAYSLVSDKTISFDKATEWLKGKDWSEEEALSDVQDERNLLMHIVETVVDVEISALTSGVVKRSVGELIRILADLNIRGAVDEKVAKFAADQRLLRMGIRIDPTKRMVYIGNQSKEIKSVLKDTAWYKNHPAMLLRIKGAIKEGNMKFAGMSMRSVGIPLEYFSN